MNINTELWSKGKSFRAFSVASGSVPSTVSIRIASGSVEMDVEEGVRRFGLREEVLVLSGYGREDWQWDLTSTTAKAKLQQFRERALAAGFKKLGKTSLE